MKRFSQVINDYTNSLIPPMTDTVKFRTLAASTAESMTVPSGAKLVILTPIGATVYVRGSVGSPDLVAAVHSGDETVGNGSIPIADGAIRMFRCDDVTSLSFISGAACTITAEFLK